MKVLVRVDDVHTEQFDNAYFVVSGVDGITLEVRSAIVGKGSPVIGVFKDWSYARYIGDGEVECFEAIAESVVENIQEKLSRRDVK